MRKTIIIAGVAICIICAALISYDFIKFTQRDAIPSQDLTLSDYPELFAKETVIVIGENATQIEKESAEAIAANLEIMTGNKPEIINTKKIESFKYSYNLVIVGTPNSNKILEEVYNMTDATRVTDEYPGENKGILEILRNPWNEEKAMLLVEGSDERGVKAGDLILRGNKKLENKAKLFVDWEEYTGVEFPIDSSEEAIRYAKTDSDVTDFMKYWSSEGYKIESWVAREPDEDFWGVGFEVKSHFWQSSIKDVWFEIHFKPDGTIIREGEGGI